MSNPMTFIRFSSENSRLNFTFLYPQEWRALQNRGTKTNYDEVMIMGPRNRQNTYNLALIVRVTPLTQREGQFPTLDALVTNYLARQKHQFREISRAKGNLAGCDAIEIEIGYTMLLPINNVNPQEMPIIERRIFFQKTGNLYEMIYRAVEEDYYQYLDLFWDAVRTFEFKGETGSQLHRPMVIPIPAHTLAEAHEEYKTKE